MVTGNQTTRFQRIPRVPVHGKGGCASVVGVRPGCVDITNADGVLRRKIRALLFVQHDVVAQGVRHTHYGRQGLVAHLYGVEGILSHIATAGNGHRHGFPHVPHLLMRERVL